MVTNSAGKIVAILSEQRVTMYKLHPNQEKYPGAVIEMVNLPYDEYHRDLWYKKGYKRTIQELMPGKKVVQDDKYGGYRFILDSPAESAKPYAGK